MKDITVTIIDNEVEYKIVTGYGEYRNLMELIRNNHYVDYFGECGGMGRCGTCLIEVLHKKTELTNLERNEETTMSKIGEENDKIRLSCQILIDESIDGLVIKVLNV